MVGHYTTESSEGVSSGPGSGWGGRGSGSLEAMMNMLPSERCSGHLPNPVSRRILAMLLSLCSTNNRNMFYLLSDGGGAAGDVGGSGAGAGALVVDGSEMMGLGELDINATSSSPDATSSPSHHHDDDDDHHLRNAPLPTTFKPLSCLLALLSRAQFQKSRYIFFPSFFLTGISLLPC
jgi:hypothetical protein